MRKGAKGRWKVSVRNAPLLEDNLRAGPVCFKSNQSIRINYPHPHHPTPPRPTASPYRVARAGTWTRGGRGVCYAFSLCNNHTRPRPVTRPTPTLKVKKRTNKNQTIKGFSLSLNKLNADFCFKCRIPFVSCRTGFFIVPVSLVLRAAVLGDTHTHTHTLCVPVSPLYEPINNNNNCLFSYGTWQIDKANPFWWTLLELSLGFTSAQRHILATCCL